MNTHYLSSIYIFILCLFPPECKNREGQDVFMSCLWLRLIIDKFLKNIWVLFDTHNVIHVIYFEAYSKYLLLSTLNDLIFYQMCNTSLLAYKTYKWFRNILDHMENS